MAKKKSIPEKQYIAIDGYRDEVICIGTLKKVADGIEEHIAFEDYAQDEVEVSIKIYELGAEKAYSVYPGKLEIVIED